jgi:DNA-binding beta-propeller fold protein YncE
MYNHVFFRSVKFFLLALFILQLCIASAYPGEIIKSFNLPGQYSTGLTFDGVNIWVADRKTDLLYCIEPATGKVVRTLQSPGYWPLALAWDGQSLWNSDLKGGKDVSEDYDGII